MVPALIHPGRNSSRIEDGGRGDSMFGDLPGKVCMPFLASIVPEVIQAAQAEVEVAAVARSSLYRLDQAVAGRHLLSDCRWKSQARISCGFS
jgi:hypothetical protein